MTNTLSAQEQADNSQIFRKDKNISSSDLTLPSCECSDSLIESQSQDDMLTLTRKVSFGHIHIREFNTELGDNPSCSSGPPLTISWNYNDADSVDLEKFEKLRPPRRHDSEMVIPSKTRKEILCDLGVSSIEITDAMKKIAVCKNSRKKSMISINYKVKQCY